MTEPESLALLAEFGVATVDMHEAHSLEAAQAAAAELGYPVVVKGVAPGAAHKTELGLVRVNLRDPAAVARAYSAIGREHVVVQSMVSGDLEAIVGVTRADGVGLVLLAGLGGIFAEALRDVVMWTLPVKRATIEADLAGSALGRILHTGRWKHPDSREAFTDLLLAVQHAALACGDALQAIDINPVILGEAGAIAVDALVVARS